MASNPFISDRKSTYRIGKNKITSEVSAQLTIIISANIYYIKACGQKQSFITPQPVTALLVNTTFSSYMVKIKMK